MQMPKVQTLALPGIAALALLLAAAATLVPVGETALATWIEAPLTDAAVRLRNRLFPRQPIAADITLVGIDDETIRQFGAYGKGDWQYREPFARQLPYYARVFQPRVLAYDIIFQENVAGGEWSPARLRELGRTLSTAADRRDRTLPELQRLLFEQQADKVLAQLFAEAADEQFAERLGALAASDCTVIFAHFIPSRADDERQWTEADLLGDDPGNRHEDNGLSVPYLRDVAIAHDLAGAAPELARYAELPQTRFLDYTQLGCISVPRAHDGSVRRLPLVHGIDASYPDPDSGAPVTRHFFVPSLALLAVLAHWGIDLPTLHREDRFLVDGEPVVELIHGRALIVRRPDGPTVRIPLDRQNRFYLDYVGQVHDFPTVPFHAVTEPPWLRREADGTVVVAPELHERLHDRLVFVGTMFTGGTDVGPTPVGANTPMAHVHMVAASNILTGTFLTPTGPHATLLLLVLLAAAVAPLMWRLRAVATAWTLAGVALAWLGLAFALLCLHLRVLPVVAPLLLLSVCLVGAVLWHYLVEEREKQRIRGMFSTMVSGEVLTYMEDHPQSFSLAGERREATMFFSDVAGFTTIAEGLDADRLVQLLNAYLSPMTDIILRHRGYLDKYEGDAVMAEWGVPYPDADHARRACAAALEQQAALAELRPRLRAEFGYDLHVRMGLNSGVVSAGNMGCARRFSYTVLGDAVNQAARFEPANKDYGTLIMLGDSTWQAVQAHFAGRQLDRLVVKGKCEPVAVHELLGWKEQVDSAILAAAALYEQALAAHWQRHWDDALDLLDKAEKLRPDDLATGTLAARIRGYRQTPPPPAWQGQYVRPAKD